MIRHEIQKPESYTIRLGPYIADISPAITFAPYLRQHNTFIVSTGSDAPIPISTRRILRGASTCIGGLSILDGKAYMFHYDQSMSDDTLPLITNATAGLIGGRTDLFFGPRQHTILQRFAHFGDGTLSLMIHHHSKNHLDIRYMLDT